MLSFSIKSKTATLMKKIQAIIFSSQRKRASRPGPQEPSTAHLHRQATTGQQIKDINTAPFKSRISCRPSLVQQHQKEESDSAKQHTVIPNANTIIQLQPTAL
ncbi:hypothetical protein Nepgr_023072 [Nepenthes gracilis]|uniref:Uncharacterized protein n=1 Tax=Nepenthes gracilis TaxID=150966 RepID=A0AAD3T0L4_NEPGR|nr:hypothetical protein Nepgr_023072 [Nepenthes gracilis]